MTAFPKNPFVFLWQYALRNKGIFAATLICSIIAVLAGKSVPWVFAKMVACFEKGLPFAEIASTIWILLAALVLAGVVSALCEAGANVLVEVFLRPKVYQQMSHDCFEHINGHSLAYFADNMAGALAQKSNSLSDCSTFYPAIFYYLFDSFSLLVVFVMLAAVSPMFALYFVLAIALSAAVAFKFAKLSMNLRADMIEARAKVSGEMIDALQNNFFIRLFSGFRHEKNRLNKVLQDETAKVNKSTDVEFLQTESEKLYFKIICLLFFFYALFLWKEKTLQTADVVLIFFLLQSVSETVAFLIHRAIVYSGIFAEIRTNLIPFTTAHEIVDCDNAKELKITQGQIELKNVCFAYKNAKPLFVNFNLAIKAGEKLGIVGMSGGGKSTLINLLQRFYDIDSGEILFDGQNIKEVRQESLHKAIGYVPQSSTLLERSVRENIAYGRPGCTQEEIEHAAKDAFADMFIADLPNGYKTIINAQNQLSGGQMQRLSIARVLLKDAPILILDEATSALDSESEFYIQKAIENMLKDKTVIAVAHRLSTLKNMDRIVVMEKGKIVEDGSLDELLKKKDKFYQYWNLQSLKAQKGGRHEK